MPPTPTMDDLRTVPHDDVLADAEKRTGHALDREHAHYSRFNGTVGFPTAVGTWVRLAWCRPGQLSSTSWTGIEASVAIKGVPRPQWFAGSQWHDPERGVVWRVDEMSRAPAPAVSPAGTVDQDPDLPALWWRELGGALAVLARHDTHRVCLRQEHLTARIREAYGDAVDTTITEWACAHGDVGWANVTAPELTLLDWESWGNAPAGYDAACLWSASLPVPALAERVLAEFDDVLGTRPGRLSRLMLCANIERAHRRSGKTTRLTAPARVAAQGLLDLLG
ncbi:aminoglycoside phosphotransferase [Streptomyces sp. LP05-1]|uniref:Aminoglycoside phosphotransferase n=1 Tax=Streptomyces pyxinae TaxID=2970734 RepID=A0ABT2CM08_9ACTN|nr:aminoglycoside phosphotransferase [Streptomyces sp. LP05-1]MCS0638355.1 aminoglycoside phosphotransferase [Streptomyces sp. LP05-1]